MEIQTIFGLGFVNSLSRLRMNDSLHLLTSKVDAISLKEDGALAASGWRVRDYSRLPESSREAVPSILALAEEVTLSSQSLYLVFRTDLYEVICIIFVN